MLAALSFLQLAAPAYSVPIKKPEDRKQKPEEKD